MNSKETSLHSPLEHEGSKADPFRTFVPTIYVWAELRITSGMRRLLHPEDLVAEVWSQAHLRKITNLTRSRVLSLAGAQLLEAQSRMRMQIFFSGGRPNQNTLGFARASRDICSSVTEWLSMPSTNHLIQAVNKLNPILRKLLLYRGLEGLDDSTIMIKLGCGEESLNSHWHDVLTVFAEAQAWKELHEILETN